MLYWNELPDDRKEMNFCMLSPLEAGEVSHVPAFPAFTPTPTPVPFPPLLPSEAKGLLSCGNHVNMVARACVNSS